MTMLEIGTICNKTSVMVRNFNIASACKEASSGKTPLVSTLWLTALPNAHVQIPLSNLSVPIFVSLPTRTDAPLEALHSRLRAVQCPASGRRATLSALCSYASGRNASVSITCDGSTSIVNYRCPVIPRCAVWDASMRTWSTLGTACLPMLSTRAGPATLRCTVSQTGVFAAVVDREVDAVTTLMSQGPLPERQTVRSFGLIYAGRMASQEGGELVHTRPPYVN
jgi:hypothetical protein